MSTRPKLISGGHLLILAVVAVACSDTTTPAAPAPAPQPAPAPALSAPMPLAPTETRLEVASNIMNFTMENLSVAVGITIF